MRGAQREFEVVVVGGGHAGLEAAWACANGGRATALVTLDPSRIGVMSCNPAIGGLAKGQIVREIDALGGLMALATDATGIMFKTLNASRGPAVRGPRAQCDKHAYARETRRLVAGRPEIEVIAGSVDDLFTETSPSRERSITGVLVSPPRESGDPPIILRARAVVLTTGTFMRGLMHTGESQTHGGRIGEGAAVGISGALHRLGFEIGRLKTGTPPRLARSSIDWEALEPQHGDQPPRPFSDLAEPALFPGLRQVECRITSTNAPIHELIRANLHRAPMYSGQIKSAGPRYCPSIEDKVVRFAERTSHHVFLEPESLESDWIYCNGISTSLPREVQDEIVRAMPGCERARILQHGYAVEYDMVPPHQIDASTMTRSVRGLFLAGQINGTSGYEEAAGQGLLAGLNAGRFTAGVDPVVFGRDYAYIGVMMDDLVTKTPREPYRMFTSRAEHRLLLRADNSADRLTPRGREWGIVDDRRWESFQRRSDLLSAAQAAIRSTRIGGEPLAAALRRPEYTVLDLVRDLTASTGENCWGRPRSLPVLETVLAEHQYEGYVRRQQAEVKRQAEMERRSIPPSMNYEAITGLRSEARSALTRFRPATFGQASRLEGVCPADLTLLLVAAERCRLAAL